MRTILISNIETDSQSLYPPPMPSPENQWWTIHGSELLAALERAHAGDHPSIVYAELYANAEVSHQ